MPIDAVIFDLDDTLLDWWGSLDRCIRRIVDAQSADALFDYCRNELWKLDPSESFIWHRNTWALHHHRHDIWPAALPDMERNVRDALIEQFDCDLFVELFDEVVPTLESLRSNVRLAIMSNNHLLADEVIRLGLDEWFETCHIAPIEQLKPHPGAFSGVLSALDLEPGSCMYVGDSIKADVGGAEAAGLIPVWVDRWNDGWHDRPAHVHRIESLEGIPELLGRLQYAEHL